MIAQIDRTVAHHLHPTVTFASRVIVLLDSLCSGYPVLHRMAKRRRKAMKAADPAPKKAMKAMKAKKA